MQKIILSIILSLVLIGLVGYGLFVFSPLLKKPNITVNTPQNGEIVSGTEVQVRGTVENVSKLTLNNTLLTISKSGTFEGRLAIWEGHTILILTGYDRFGRSVTVSRIIGTK